MVKCIILCVIIAHCCILLQLLFFALGKMVMVDIEFVTKDGMNIVSLSNLVSA